MLRHRNDIDGLRSVAVIPIMLFHAGVSTLRGGFTGVDVFFVISGYLITSTILGDLGNHKFSILNFYQRRVARILPAVLFMIFCVGLIAPAILIIPGEISDLFLSTAAATGFISNIYFWSEVDYFARAAESRPMLHTWSLGVEEQFYIFFPLLMLALKRRSAKFQAIFFVVLSVFSLASGIFIHGQSPESDFYLLPFRSWELLIGALIALGMAPALPDKAREFSALLGAGLILGSIFFLVNWLPFPSPLAIAPCIGTALLIAYGEGTRVGRVLALAPLRWIGLISFALYLWHWPIITLYRELTGDRLSALETVGLIFASFVAASISYYLVEQPARRALRLWSPRKAVGVGALATGTMAALSLALAANARQIWPIDENAEAIARYQTYKEDWDVGPMQEVSSTCFIGAAGAELDQARCLAVAPDKRNVMLFGDSHAQMYGAALRKAHPDINWLQATHFGCPPVKDGWANPSCSGMVRKVLDVVIQNPEIEGIILVSRWRKDLVPQLEKTIALIRKRGIQVTVIGPVPEYQGSLPIILARAVQSKDVGSAKRFLNPEIASTDRAIRAAAEKAGARYYSVYDALCPGNECQLFAPDGGPTAFDYGHLTFEGSNYAIRGLRNP